MKVGYITYENVLNSGILYSQVIVPVNLMTEHYNTVYKLLSYVKDNELNSGFLNDRSILNDSVELIEVHKSTDSRNRLYDAVLDTIKSFTVVKSIVKECQVLHVRGYGLIILTLILSKVYGKPVIFDMRGLLPEESVASGKIRLNGLRYRLLKLVELLGVKHSDMVFTVSKPFSEYISENYALPSQKLMNIGSPALFQSSIKRNLERSVISFVYAGSMMPWHDIEKLASVWKEMATFDHRFKLKVATSSPEKVKQVFNGKKVLMSSVEIRTYSSEEMQEVLAESDVAFNLNTNSLITKVCAPVKIGSYVSNNLLIIYNKGIGDLDELMTAYDYAICLDDHTVKDLSLKIREKLDRSCDYRSNVPALNWRIRIRDLFNVYKNLC